MIDTLKTGQICHGPLNKNFVTVVLNLFLPPLTSIFQCISIVWVNSILCLKCKAEKKQTAQQITQNIGHNYGYNISRNEPEKTGKYGLSSRLKMRHF